MLIFYYKNNARSAEVTRAPLSKCLLLVLNSTAYPASPVDRDASPTITPLKCFRIWVSTDFRRETNGDEGRTADTLVRRWVVAPSDDARRSSCCKGPSCPCFAFITRFNFTLLLLHPRFGGELLGI